VGPILLKALRKRKKRRAFHLPKRLPNTKGKKINWVKCTPGRPNNWTKFLRFMIAFTLCFMMGAIPELGRGFRLG
jgi:hypothetical protein